VKRRWESTLGSCRARVLATEGSDSAVAALCRRFGSCKGGCGGEVLAKCALFCGLEGCKISLAVTQLAEPTSPHACEAKLRRAPIAFSSSPLLTAEHS
jgi:hypothetical protein